ncbi:MAG: hypothetical protein WBQ87_16415, partial [Candidatus Sulfotelmatobacter sp.]
EPEHAILPIAWIAARHAADSTAGVALPGPAGCTGSRDERAAGETRACTAATPAEFASARPKAGDHASA